MKKNYYIDNPLSANEKKHILSASKKAKQKKLLEASDRKNLYLTAKQDKWFINNISYFFNSLSSYAINSSNDSPHISYSSLTKIFDTIKPEEKIPEEKIIDKDILYQIGAIYADFFRKTEDMYLENDDVKLNIYYHLHDYLYIGKAQKSYLKALSQYKENPNLTPLFIRALEYFDLASDHGHYLAQKAYCKQYLEYAFVISTKKNSKYYKKTLKTLRKLSKNGDSDAQCALGLIISDPESYNGDEKDYSAEEAINLWKMAEKNHKQEAMYYLGDAFYYGKLSVKKDRQRGIDILTTAANSVYEKSPITDYTTSCAQYLLSHIYLYEDNIDYASYRKKHFYWLNKVIEGPASFYTPLAYKDLGDYKYVLDDYKSALLMYKKASDLRNLHATVLLGHLFRDRKGVEKNIKKAISYYLIAAESANAEANIALGDIYLDGQDVRQNYKKALKYFEVAVEYHDDAEAMNRLGHMYENGLGMKKNILKAKSYYKNSIKGNYELGYINLARLYMESENYKKALKLYHQAIENFDSSYAYMHLGIIYSQGLGVDINNDLALENFLKAKDLDHEEAQAHIDDLDNEIEHVQFIDNKKEISKLLKSISQNIAKTTMIEGMTPKTKKVNSTKGNKNIFAEKIRELSIPEMLEMNFEDPSEIKNFILSKEESKHLEFKASLITDYPNKKYATPQHRKESHKRLEEVCLKSICAFLNTDGGILMIGIHDKDNKKKVVGIEREILLNKEKLPSIDNYLLYLHDKIESCISGKFFEFINISVVLYKSKSLCIVKVKKLPNRDSAYFSKNKYFTRVGNSTRLREGEDLAYILYNRYKKNNN